MPKRLLGAVAVASTTVALALPAFAGATVHAGERSFPQTFPVASHLCTEVAAGKRKHLASVSAAVAADCATLQSNFTAAQTAVVTTRTTIRAQIAADKSTIAAACPKPTNNVQPACLNTRHAQNIAIAALRSQMLAAVHLYYKTIESDRRAFWAEIKALRPARHLHLVPDKPIKQQND
jgi:hypothetical protein